MIAFGHALRRAGSWLGLLGLLVLAGQARAEPAMTPLILGFYLPGIRDANPTDIRASLQLWVEEIAKPYRLQGWKVGDKVAFLSLVNGISQK